MSRIFWINIYRLIIFPLIYISAHTGALFSKKVRIVLKKKYSVVRELRKWLEENHEDAPKYIIFHAASLGEYEHIRPVLFKLNRQFDSRNIVTFFSPSGLQNVRTGNGVHYTTYMPFDTFSQWGKIYRLVKPVMVVIAKHDVWPAQIWSARDHNIPVFLINASLSSRSTRAKFPFGRILSIVYRDFNEIMTISEEDKERFQKYFSGLNLKVCGDTKYDQVLLRMEQARQDPPLNMQWRKGKIIFAAGSIWPEDEEHLLPALTQLLKKQDKFQIILVPHQPTDAAVNRLEKYFAEQNPQRFSNLHDRNPQSRVVIVDQIGYLAGLYLLADMAYVGGSFKQGIHSTMEAAVYGIPVIYGPVHKNSYEAVKLIECGGAFPVRNRKEIFTTVTQLLTNADLMARTGKNARTYALENTGATENLIQAWSELLKGKN